MNEIERCGAGGTGRDSSRRTDTRRVFIRRAVALGVAACALPTFAARSRAQAKSTKEQAQYKDTTDQGVYCKDCAYFRPSNGCKIVEGDVQPLGWCALWDFEDRF